MNLRDQIHPLSVSVFFFLLSILFLSFCCFSHSLCSYCFILCLLIYTVLSLLSSIFSAFLVIGYASVDSYSILYTVISTPSCNLTFLAQSLFLLNIPLPYRLILPPPFPSQMAIQQPFLCSRLLATGYNLFVKSRN